MQTYTEQHFEDHIEALLNQSGYRSLQPASYNKSLCLIPNETLQFIQNTQPDVYRRLERQYGADAPVKLLYRVSNRLRVEVCWTCFEKALRIEVVILS